MEVQQAIINFLAQEISATSLVRTFMHTAWHVPMRGEDWIKQEGFADIFTSPDYFDALKKKYPQAYPDTTLKTVLGTQLFSNLSEITYLTLNPETEFALYYQQEQFSLLSDYAKAVIFEKHLAQYFVQPEPTFLSTLKYYDHFWFVFDANEDYSQTQWLLTPSSTYFYMPAIFTAEDALDEFVHHPALPPTELGKTRQKLCTNGHRLFTMLSQLNVDQIAINPHCFLPTHYFDPKIITEIIAAD